jgi:hypothetical protein
MPTMTCVSIWRCNCGMTIRAVTEQVSSERKFPGAPLSGNHDGVVTCPQCGNKRFIECDRIMTPLGVRIEFSRLIDRTSSYSDQSDFKLLSVHLSLLRCVM